MERVLAPTGWSPATVVAASTAASLARAALGYAQAGAPVFPVAPEGKAPLTKRGFLDASSDLRRVASWWRRWPSANVGLPTGAVSGVAVVDVDVHGDATGFPGFESARRTGLVSSWAWLVRTPSGGVHAYFPHALEQRSWALADAQVDFRGDGGYVVAPPSRVRTTSGAVRPYELLVVAQHAPAPVDAAALRVLLSPPPPARARDRGAEAVPERLAQWLAARPEGGRNGGLFWAACRMVEDGFDQASVRGLLGDAAQQAGLGERETDATIRSAFRRTGPRAPRGRRRPGHPPAISRSGEAVSR